MDTSIATAAEGAGNAGTGILSSPPAAKLPAGEKPDAVEFEIALQLQDLESEGFEAAVAAAADSAGGALLFDMPMPAIYAVQLAGSDARSAASIGCELGVFCNAQGGVGQGTRAVGRAEGPQLAAQESSPQPGIAHCLVSSSQ